MEPVKRILRIGKEVYTVDANEFAQVKVATCDTISIASWVAFSLAACHMVSLEEREE
jgi:hypothetical protein